MSLSRTALAERNAHAEADADRVRRNDFLRSGALCLAWAAVGLYFVGWSAHTTDPTLGAASFFAGLGIGNGGIIFTVLRAYLRGEARGDW